MCDMGGPFSEKDAAILFRQFADGLSHIHETKKYVHADLKPENLMMGAWGENPERDWELKIIDFGFAVPDVDDVDGRGVGG